MSLTDKFKDFVNVRKDLENFDTLLKEGDSYSLTDNLFKNLPKHFVRGCLIGGVAGSAGYLFSEQFDYTALISLSLIGGFNRCWSICF